MTAVAKYVSQNINYPADLKESGVEGLVVIEFTVDTTGSITKTKVLRSAHPELDQEALRLVSEMPKWEAGLKDGKKTPVKQKLPINFKLSEEERKAVDQKLIEAAGQ